MSKTSLILNGLKARLSESNLLQVQFTEGKIGWVSFQFNTAATEKEILNFYVSRQWIIPEDYYQFLQLHNGVRLFEHPTNGGGVFIFSLHEIEQVHAEYEYMFPEHCFPVAMMNSAMIIVDTKATQTGTHYLLWQDCVSTNDHALNLKMDFATWLEFLILSQGNEFWFWPTLIPPTT
jgi:hypothetical protein